ISNRAVHVTIGRGGILEDTQVVNLAREVTHIVGPIALDDAEQHDEAVADSCDIAIGVGGHYRHARGRDTLDDCPHAGRIGYAPSGRTIGGPGSAPTPSRAGAELACPEPGR